MSEENLKAIQPKAFKPKTTDSKGTSAVPNLVAEINIQECAAGKLLLTTLPKFGCAAVSFVIWQSGKIR